jgi:WD40-like Beta Propeller Repeat
MTYGPAGRCLAMSLVSFITATAALAGDAVLWSPEGISSPQWESHPAFDPRTGDFYFVRSSAKFEGWRILVSTCGKDGWSVPEPPSFAGPGLEADPFFTGDGATLYFISTRLTGSAAPADLDIWLTRRAQDGSWETPERLPEPVNSSAAEWFPRLSTDGWLYFGSNRPGGLGGNDIWRARRDGADPWRVENLGPPINTAGQEYEALPSADGARLIVNTADGFYESRRNGAGWSARRKLPPEVDRNGSEVGGLFSPSGRSLLFSRDTGPPGSGEFFVWHEEGTESWPRDCPRRF